MNREQRRAQKRNPKSHTPTEYIISPTTHGLVESVRAGAAKAEKKGSGGILGWYLKGYSRKEVADLRVWADTYPFPVEVVVRLKSGEMLTVQNPCSQITI